MKPRSIKSALRAAVRSLGYDIVRVQSTELGTDPYFDMRNLTGNREGLICFDVGANVGQTIGHFQHCLKRPTIHAFEPGTETFRELERRCSGLSNVSLNNVGLAEVESRLVLNENRYGDLSSFLPLGSIGGGEITRQISVDVTTVDSYCSKLGIDKIDILKIDTQGFDLRVAKGADVLFRDHRVHLVFMEVTFCQLYEGLPRLDEIYAYFAERGFELVSFYKFYYQNNRAGWTDAMFIDPFYTSAADTQ